jgi:hypothetical protein
MDSLDGANADPAEDHRGQPERRVYMRPTLSLIGDMKTLTAGGTLTNGELFDDDELPRP